MKGLFVEELASRDYHRDDSPRVGHSIKWGTASMNTVEYFRREVKWTATEKKVARKAFDKALERHCIAAATEARRMLENMTDPSDVWGVEAYLSERRKTMDRTCHYSYSDLLDVFSTLTVDGWLKEEDLGGIQPQKIADIKNGAEALRRIFQD
jgi:hypothetical protein